jgi:hypothetical protein
MDHFQKSQGGYKLPTCELYSSYFLKMVNWHTVIVGMFVQFIIALFVLRSGVGCKSCKTSSYERWLINVADDIFNFISELARDLLGFANQVLKLLDSTYIDLISSSRAPFSLPPPVYQPSAGSSYQYCLQSSSSWPLFSCVFITASFNGSLVNSPSFSSGRCGFLVPKLWSRRHRHSSVKENRPCLSSHSSLISPKLSSTKLCARGSLLSQVSDLRI